MEAPGMPRDSQADHDGRVGLVKRLGDAGGPESPDAQHDAPENCLLVPGFARVAAEVLDLDGDCGKVVF